MKRAHRPESGSHSENTRGPSATGVMLSESPGGHQLWLLLLSVVFSTVRWYTPIIPPRERQRQKIRNLISLNNTVNSRLVWPQETRKQNNNKTPKPEHWQHGSALAAKPHGLVHPGTYTAGESPLPKGVLLGPQVLWHAFGRAHVHKHTVNRQNKHENIIFPMKQNHRYHPLLPNTGIEAWRDLNPQ